jgi:hypothetical protein
MYKFIEKCKRFENFSIFIISVLLYLLNRFIILNINNSIIHYFFSGYFDDLLAPILLFSYINILLSFYNKKIYSLKYLIISILIVSIVWEYLIVFIKPTSVSDPIDVIFYVLGTLIYWIIHKKWNQKNNTSLT